MAIDSTAADSAERLNKVIPAGLPSAADRPTEARYQGTLWAFEDWRASACGPEAAQR